jgi:parallel beta-helix repeat protein
MRTRTNAGRPHGRLWRASAVLALAGGFMVAILGATTSTALAGGGGNEYVNASSGHDSGSCRIESNPCLTISYAVSQAALNPGTTIHVAQGSYPEQVTISTNLTIEGAGVGNTQIDPSSLPSSDTDTDSGTPQYAIVDVVSGATVSLKDLTVNGEQAQTQFDGCSDDFVGVYYHDASGTISSVDVENIQLPPDDFGCQDGLAIYVATDSDTFGAARSSTNRFAVGASGRRLSPVDAEGTRSRSARPTSAGDPPSSSVTMDYVTVTTYDKNGITCDDVDTTCVIKNSTVTGIGPTNAIAQNGIQGYGASSLTLSKDTVTGNSYTGPTYAATGVLLIDQGALSVTSCTASSNDYNFYLLYDGSASTVAGTWSISKSTATDSTMGDGIAVDSTSNSVTVASNKTLTGNLGNGIALYGTTDTTVQDNSANSNTLNGIYVGGPGTLGSGSTTNTVQSNTVNDNSNDGILADSDASSNTFSSNHATDDVDYDYQDLGTGNSWTSNTCRPAHDSSPGGLC